MIDNPIMTFTNVVMAPHPLAHGWLCTASRLRRRKAVLCETLPTPPFQGGDRKVLASLEMVYRGACRLVRIQS